MSIEAIFEAVLEGNAPEAASQVEAAIAAGISPNAVLYDGCIAAMDKVGKLFEQGEYFVPEMLISARAMQSAMDILKPYLAEEEIGAAGTVVIGTVAGDLHDIGKNLVGMMLGGAGFKVIDLGTDVASKDFVKAVNENSPDLIGMSALLTTTLPAMEKTIQALKEAGLRDKVKVMVGGAPVTQDYADQIGADGFAPDASQATRLAKALLA